jgi:predicted enzyme related to lactoylglutathione lyase
MSERSGYAAGTPSWVDLGSPDPDASAGFYGELFGWDAEEAGPAEETGGYRLLKLNGKTVGGLMKLQSDEQPPAWSTYVATDDADATASSVKDAGGQVFMEPMDVMDAGRMAFFIDPAGAFFGVWQEGANKGAELVNEPGALCWNELQTRDLEGSKSFYSQVFGWEANSSSDGPFAYAEWQLDGEDIGGLLEIDEHRIPADVPSHWMAYFAVADADATVAKAKELSANVVAGPMDIPVGRFAAMIDPQEAAFGVVQLAREGR